MTRRGRQAVGLGLVLVALVCAACGVGTQGAAQLIDPGQVPSGLLGPASTTTTAPASSVSVTLFFEAPGGLVPVVRHVRPPASVAAALKQLSLGPTATDGGGTLQSPVSTVLPLDLKRVDGGTAVVSVPASFAELGGQDQIVATAQIVFTATAVPGIGAVVLLVNGQPAQVPVSGGNLKEGPLTRADFSGMLAP